MKTLNYHEFLKLVLEASGPFSYRFNGLSGNHVCAPVIYIALNWTNRARLERAVAARETK